MLPQRQVLRQAQDERGGVISGAGSPKRSAAKARCPGGAFRIKKLPKRPETKEEEGGRRKCASGFSTGLKFKPQARQLQDSAGVSVPFITLVMRPRKAAEFRRIRPAAVKKCVPAVTFLSLRRPQRATAHDHRASQVLSSSACSCSSFRICSTSRLVVGSLSPIKSTIWLYASMATRSAIRLARIISFKSFDAL